MLHFIFSKDFFPFLLLNKLFLLTSALLFGTYFLFIPYILGFPIVSLLACQNPKNIIPRKCHLLQKECGWVSVSNLPIIHYLS